MDQTTLRVVVKDLAWLLLQAVIVAVSYFVVWRLWGKNRSSSPGLKKPYRGGLEFIPGLSKRLIQDDLQSHGTSDWASMGEVIPVPDLDYRSVKPLRIYKFNAKYFLTMGLQKSDINSITQIDDTYKDRLSARQGIVHQYPGALACLDSGLDMLNELYEFLVQAYLPTRYPTIFRHHPSLSSIENSVTNESLPHRAPSNWSETLQILNRNIDEDFLMLLPSPDDDGYSLQSFIWAYPVGFDPQSKLGLKLRDAHQPVPGYKEKIGLSMDRYFNNLEPGNIKYRVNWALATNDNLCERGEYHLYPGQEPTEKDFDLKDCYVRCELQTLFSLPKTGGRILSVHLYLYPLQEIKDVGLGPAMVEAIDGFRDGNIPEFYRYKRAVVWGERVKAFLLN